jgi:hypothetical protein
MTSFLETRYGLRRDPFTEYPASIDQVLYYSAGHEKEKAQWSQIVQTKRGQLGNSLNFIVGDYGLGKTFSLYSIYAQFRGDPGLLVRYVKLLREDTVSRFGVDFIQRIFRAVGSEYMQARLKPEPLREIRRLFPEPSNVFTRILDGNPLARVFLNGEVSLSRSEMHSLGVMRKLDKTEVAKEYLLVFLVLLRYCGVESLILTVDETEYVFSQMSEAKLGNVFNTLRDFYDLPQSLQASELGMPLSNMILFLAISASGWDNLTKLERREQAKGGPVQPLLSRRDAVIMLNPLNEDESEQLIESRLRYNRVKGKFEDQPLIPYSPDIPQYVYRLTRGNPRDIIKTCEYILSDGLQQRVPLLTIEFSKRVLESRGLPTEPT